MYTRCNCLNSANPLPPPFRCHEADYCLCNDPKKIRLFPDDKNTVESMYLITSENGITFNPKMRRNGLQDYGPKYDSSGNIGKMSGKNESSGYPSNYVGTVGSLFGEIRQPYDGPETDDPTMWYGKRNGVQDGGATFIVNPLQECNEYPQPQVRYHCCYYPQYNGYC